MAIGLTFESDGTASTFSGSLRAAVQRQAKTAEGVIAEANTAAMRSVVRGYTDQLQADIAGSGMTNAARLAKTWQGRAYPDPGRASLSPGGYVFNRAELIVDAFTLGVTITAAGGRFLAIPVGPAKAIVRRLNLAANRTRVDGRFADEAGTVQRVAQALSVPKLELRIDRRLGAGVLVAPGHNLNDRARRFKRTADTVLFILVKQATLKRRMRGRELLAELEARFPADFAAAAQVELDARTTA